jgi:CheY-like chemotaxis protein
MLRTPEGLVPARPLNAWLGAPREDDTAALVVDIAGRRAALLVARTASEVDLLRTPADPLLSCSTRVAASGILPDGRVTFFLRWGEVLRELAQLSDEQVAVARRTRAHVPRVLVVDDSPVIRDIIGEVLTAAGMDVKSATDGRTALELMEGEQFDLVVSDIEMPKMDGLELLQAVRQRSAILPVVMLTTRSKPEHRREAALLGANAYIAKSEFHGDTLMEVVRRFVDLPA